MSPPGGLVAVGVSPGVFSVAGILAGLWGLGRDFRGSRSSLGWDLLALRSLPSGFQGLLVGYLVAELVHGVSGVAPDVGEGDDGSLGEPEKLFPQLPVGDGLLPAGAPAVLLPFGEPALVEAVADVLGVRADLDVHAVDVGELAQVGQSLDHGLHFHPVVGGAGVMSLHADVVVPGYLDDRGVAAGSGVAVARPVGVDDYP